MKTFGIIFLLSFSLIFGTQDVFADTLFFDDFSTDPASNGWTEISLPPFMGTISPFNPPHVGHGNEVIFEKTLNDGIPVSTSITREVSTIGFENIQVSLTAHQQSGAALEDEDYLEISVDTNNDGIFESVLKDEEGWEGMQDITNFDRGHPSNFNPTSTGFLLLSDVAANNPNLKIRIEANFEGSDEQYFLTEFEVIGDAIQENNVIGGKIIPIESTSLILAGSQSFSWIILIAFSFTGIGLLVFFKKSKNL